MEHDDASTPHLGEDVGRDTGIDGYGSRIALYTDIGQLGGVLVLPPDISSEFYRDDEPKPTSEILTRVRTCHQTRSLSGSTAFQNPCKYLGSSIGHVIKLFAKRI